jgi:hypothetical protein
MKAVGLLRGISPTINSSGTWTAKAHHRLCVANDVVLHGVVRCGKKFTFPLIPPSLEPDDPLATPSNSIRLAMDNDRVLSDECDALVHELTKSVRNDMCRTLVTDLADTGAFLSSSTLIQQLTSSPFVLPQSGCYGINDLVILPITICIMLTNTLMVSQSSTTLIQSWNSVRPAYVQNNPRSPLVRSTCTADQPFQSVSIDFSFTSVRSKDEKRKKDFVVLNGETCWILVTDHFTHAVFGDTRVSKASPIELLRAFLKQYSPQCPGKYVYLDQVGKLYANPAVRDIFSGFGYEARPTSSPPAHGIR